MKIPRRLVIKKAKEDPHADYMTRRTSIIDRALSSKFGFCCLLLLMDNLN